MNRREFKHFLLIARASNCELQTQLELSGALGFADAQLLNTTKEFHMKLRRCSLRC